MVGPRSSEFLDIARIDLIEWRVAHTARVVPVSGPVLLCEGKCGNGKQEKSFSHGGPRNKADYSDRVRSRDTARRTMNLASTRSSIRAGTANSCTRPGSSLDTFHPFLPSPPCGSAPLARHDGSRRGPSRAPQPKARDSAAAPAGMSRPDDDCRQLSFAWVEIAPLE